MGRVALVLLGLALLGGAWLWSRFPRAESPRVEATPDAVGVDTGGSFAWIVKTKRGAALIDAGMDPRGEAIRAELDAEGITPEKVHTILITHGHADHWAAAHLFPNAKVWVGPGEAKYVKGDERYRALGPSLLARAEGSAPAPVQLQELGGDETLDVDGESVRVIHTPGHTPGSVCFLWRGVLFSGDAVLGEGKGVGLAPSFLSEDPDEARSSLRKLVDLPFALMADGHVGATADARQKLRRFLR